MEQSLPIGFLLMLPTLFIKTIQNIETMYDYMNVHKNFMLIRSMLKYFCCVLGCHGFTRGHLGPGDTQTTGKKTWSIV